MTRALKHNFKRDKQDRHDNKYRMHFYFRSQLLKLLLNVNWFYSITFKQWQGEKLITLYQNLRRILIINININLYWLYSYVIKSEFYFLLLKEINTLIRDMTNQLHFIFCYACLETLFIISISVFYLSFLIHPDFLDFHVVFL